jgi:hypothetical protein
LIFIKRLLMSCKWESICPLRRLEQSGVIDLRWKTEYCTSESNWKKCRRYQAEERGESHSDYLMPDGSFINSNE